MDRAHNPHLQLLSHLVVLCPLHFLERLRSDIHSHIRHLHELDIYHLGRHAAGRVHRYGNDPVRILFDEKFRRQEQPRRQAHAARGIPVLGHGWSIDTLACFAILDGMDMLCK